MMKRRLLPALLTIAMSGIILAGCYNDNEEDLYPSGSCNLTAVTYTLTVKPIIQANCALSGCHIGAAPGAGIDLSDYTGLKAIATNGQLLGAINHSSGFSAMPKNASKLPQCNLDQIKKWVDDGALNN